MRVPIRNDNTTSVKSHNTHRNAHLLNLFEQEITVYGIIISLQVVLKFSREEKIANRRV